MKCCSLAIRWLFHWHEEAGEWLCFLAQPNEGGRHAYITKIIVLCFEKSIIFTFIMVRNSTKPTSVNVYTHPFCFCLLLPHLSLRLLKPLLNNDNPVITYSPACRSKPVWDSFFCWTQAMDFHSMGEKYIYLYLSIRALWWEDMEEEILNMFIDHPSVPDMLLLWRLCTVSIIQKLD